MFHLEYFRILVLKEVYRFSMRKKGMGPEAKKVQISLVNTW